METNVKKEMDSNEAVLTLSITSRLSGIPAHSIRQYIAKGLLIPYKLDSKRHLFSSNDVKRLKHIQYLIHKKGLNFAGIRSMFSMLPCWVHMECSVEERELCEAFRAFSSPCWEASNKAVVCKNTICRECKVYASLSHTDDLKSFIRELT